MISTYKKYSSADNNLEVLYSKKKNGLLTLSKTVSITILFNSYIKIFLQFPVKSSFLFFTHLSQLCCLVACAEQRPPNIQAWNSCLYAPNRLEAYTSTKTATKQKHPLLPRPVQSIQNLSVTYHLTNKTSYCEKQLDVFNYITLSLYNLL